MSGLSPPRRHKTGSLACVDVIGCTALVHATTGLEHSAGAQSSQRTTLRSISTTRWRPSWPSSRSSESSLRSLRIAGWSHVASEQSKLRTQDWYSRWRCSSLEEAKYRSKRGEYFSESADRGLLYSESSSHVNHRTSSVYFGGERRAMTSCSSSRPHVRLSPRLSFCSELEIG